jgi:hypothetical protein
MYDVSKYYLVSTGILDGASSWQRPELNPALGGGQFGARQMAVKAGFTAGVLVIEHLALRACKDERCVKRYRRAFSVVNFAAGSTYAGFAVRNWRQPR